MNNPLANHFTVAHIFQINMSQGGVPKTAVSQAQVHSLGLVGDLHANPKAHGGIERAICLYPLELILALQSEGHPVFPGALGENITLVGVNWDEMKPQTRLKIGSQVEIEITRYTTPCKTITPFFVDGDIQRVSNDAHPGWSRVYARVLTDGLLTVGDLIEKLVQ